MVFVSSFCGKREGETLREDSLVHVFMLEGIDSQWDPSFAAAGVEVQEVWGPVYLQAPDNLMRLHGRGAR